MMNTGSLRAVAICVALVRTLTAAPLESKIVFDLLKEGAAISPAKAAGLEKKLSSKPRDPQARIQLLA